MQMLELVQLIKRYADRTITYSEFRREFVVRFLSVRSGDAALDGAVAQIESLCADVAEKLISSESELRAKLAELMAVPSAPRCENGSTNPVQFLDVPRASAQVCISSGSTSIGANYQTTSLV
jgi:hypothetical protein